MVSKKKPSRFFSPEVARAPGYVLRMKRDDLPFPQATDISQAATATGAAVTAGIHDCRFGPLTRPAPYHVSRAFWFYSCPRRGDTPYAPAVDRVI